ncbi:MAG: hypothetical protein H6716_19915 [Polyangiaceae bacterium]|nr:hypothetical protein [Polyangiaceae bacterium]
MRMQLSSGMTFFAKFLPAVWLLLPTSLAVVLLVRWDPGFFIVAGFVLVCFTLFWFSSFRLKAVIATDHGLCVSNYVEAVLIPYSQVAHVSYSFFNRQRVTLVLKSPCRFGRQIVFVPYTYFTFFGRREHPVVEFLRVRCG